MTMNVYLVMLSVSTGSGAVKPVLWVVAPVHQLRYIQKVLHAAFHDIGIRFYPTYELTNMHVWTGSAWDTRGYPGIWMNDCNPKYPIMRNGGSSYYL